MHVSLEFIPYTGVRTVGDASACVAAINRPNAGLLIDALSVPADRPQTLPRFRPNNRTTCIFAMRPRQPLPRSTKSARKRAATDFIRERGSSRFALIAAVSDNIPVAIEAPHASLRDRPWAEQARLAREATLRLLENAAP
jgi:hypothetical protein